MSDRRYTESEITEIVKQNLQDFNRWAGSKRRDKTFRLNIPEEVLAVMIPPKLYEAYSHIDLFPVINHRELTTKDQELDFSILNRQGKELLDVGFRVYGQAVGHDTLVLLRLFGAEGLRGKGTGSELCAESEKVARKLGFKFMIHTVNELDLTYDSIPRLVQMGWVPYEHEVSALADRSFGLRDRDFVQSTLVKDIRNVVRQRSG